MSGKVHYLTSPTGTVVCGRVPAWAHSTIEKSRVTCGWCLKAIGTFLSGEGSDSMKGEAPQAHPPHCQCYACDPVSHKLVREEDE